MACSSGSWKSKVKSLAGSPSGESQLPGSSQDRTGQGALWGVLSEGTSPIRRAPPHDRITPKGPIFTSKDPHTGNYITTYDQVGGKGAQPFGL